MKGFDEPSVRHRVSVDGNAICMNYSRRRRFFSTLRGRTRANRRQHSIIPFVLLHWTRSWELAGSCACTIVIPGSPRIHYLPSLLPVRTYHPLLLLFLFYFFYFILLHRSRARIDANKASKEFLRSRGRIYAANESDLLVFFFFFFSLHEEWIRASRDKCACKIFRMEIWTSKSLRCKIFKRSNDSGI